MLLTLVGREEDGYYEGFIDVEEILSRSIGVCEVSDGFLMHEGKIAASWVDHLGLRWMARSLEGSRWMCGSWFKDKE